MSKPDRKPIRRSLHFEGLGTEVEVSRVVELDVERPFLYVEPLADGTFRLTYSKALVEDIRRVEAIRIVRE